jgi:V/A-type H+-transporting ATPase subunit K
MISPNPKESHMGKKKQSCRHAASRILKSRTFTFAFLLAVAIPTVIFAMWSINLVHGQNLASPSPQPAPSDGASAVFGQYGLALLGAGVAVAGSCLGAGIAISGAASAGAAAIVERPETSIWVLILAGLGEGVAIYGLLIAILIMGKLPVV